MIIIICYNYISCTGPRTPRSWFFPTNIIRSIILHANLLVASDFEGSCLRLISRCCYTIRCTPIISSYTKVGIPNIDISIIVDSPLSLIVPVISQTVIVEVQTVCAILVRTMSCRFILDFEYCREFHITTSIVKLCTDDAVTDRILISILRRRIHSPYRRLNVIDCLIVRRKITVFARIKFKVVTSLRNGARLIIYYITSSTVKAIICYTLYGSILI